MPTKAISKYHGICQIGLSMIILWWLTTIVVTLLKTDWPGRQMPAAIIISKFSTNALELSLSCTNPWIWWDILHYIRGARWATCWVEAGLIFSNSMFVQLAQPTCMLCWHDLEIVLVFSVNTNQASQSVDTSLASGKWDSKLETYLSLLKYFWNTAFNVNKNNWNQNTDTVFCVRQFMYMIHSYSAYLIILWWSWEYILYLIIIIKSEV